LDLLIAADAERAISTESQVLLMLPSGFYGHGLFVSEWLSARS
jgi:hypothetical protein